jgi:hypothetical protein
MYEPMSAPEPDSAPTFSRALVQIRWKRYVLNESVQE